MKARVLVLGVALSTAAMAAEADWRGDHWGTFVAHSSAATRVSTSTNFVAPGYDPAAGSFFRDSSVQAFNASGLSSASPSGNSLGLSWGRNWQDGARVSGIDLDIGRLNVGASRSVETPYPCCAFWGFQTAQSVDTDWVITARGRIGHAMRRSLLYGTAGLVLARLHVDARFVETSEGAQASTTLSKSKWGYALGLGFAHMFQNRWSLNAEVLYLDLGRVSSASNNMQSSLSAYPAHTFTTQARVSAQQLRVGLSKHW